MNDNFIVTLTTGKRIGLGVNNKEKKNINQEKYEIFHNLYSTALLLQEKIWIDFFLNARKGIFPKNFKFDGKNLLFKLKNKQSSIDLSSIDKSEKYELCKKFIIDNCEILSDKFKIVEDIVEENIKENIWSSFTPRLQKMYITVFAETKGKEYFFTKEKIECLKQSIIVSCFTKQIGNSQIEMKNGEIFSISSLVMNKNSYLLK